MIIILYDSTTGSGLLALLRLTTLRCYKDYIKPTTGFNPDVINDLGKKTACFLKLKSNYMLFNKMKIEGYLM